MRALGAQSIAFPEANIAPGATSPDPGVVGVTVLSTVTDELLVWDGSGWRAAPGTGGGGGGSSDPLQLLTDYSSTTPSAPATGVKLFSRTLANRRRPAFVGPSGLDTGLQAFLGANKIALWTAQGGNTIVSTFGFGNTAVGTATTRGFSTTNAFNQMRRIGYTTGTGTTCGTRNGITQYGRLGGFEYTARFGISALPSSGNYRIFCGMLASNSTFNGPGQTFSGPPGVGLLLDSTTGWRVISAAAGGSPATTHATLSTTDFPVNTANVDMYEVRLFCPPNGSTAGWSLTRLTGGSGQVATGVISTDLPPTSNPLSSIIQGSCDLANSGYAIDIVGQYIETDI